MKTKILSLYNLIIQIFFLTLFINNSFAISTKDYYHKRNPISLTQFGFADPFDGFKGSYIMQPFLSKHYRGGYKHLGADFSAPAGTVLYSICDGKILSESVDMDNYSKYKGKSVSKFDSYFNARLFIECKNPGHFIAIYGHIAHVDKYLGKYPFKGKTVRKGQAIGEVAEAFDNNNNRDWGNDHLHLGINTKMIKFFGKNGGWGIASPKVTSESVKEKGFVDPFEFLSQFKPLPKNIKATFDGAGSIIYPEDNNYGFNHDIAIMHPHNNENLQSLVVFQWFYDKNKCPYLNIFSYDDIDVYIGTKEWNKNNFIYVFKYKLDSNGVTIRRPDGAKENWFNIAIISQKPINSEVIIGARCTQDYTDVPKEFLRPTPEYVDVTGGYIWTGTSSLISIIDKSRIGINRDYVLAKNRGYENLDKKVFATIQWFKSENCPRVKISVICRNKQTKQLEICNNKFQLDEIKYKHWDTDNKNFINSGCKTLPCIIDANGFDIGYLILKIKGSINEISALKLQCVR